MIMFVLLSSRRFALPSCVCVLFVCLNVRESVKSQRLYLLCSRRVYPPRVCVCLSVCIVFVFECMCVCKRECAQIDAECVSECV